MTACICLDYQAIERFFRSCALSVEMQNSIEIKRVEYKDSRFLNAAYSIFFWREGPGHVEVDIASAAELETKIEKRTDHLVQVFLEKLHRQGFFAANEYAQKMYGIKQSAKQAISDAFASAGEINSGVIDTANNAIRRAAAIKMAAGIGVAVISGTAGVIAVSGAAGIGGISLGASQLTFTAVNVTNSSTHSIIKYWEDGSKAKAVALDFGQAGLQEGTGKVVEVIGSAANSNAIAASTARANAEVAAQRYADILGRKSTNFQNIARRTDHLAKAQAELQAAHSTAKNASRLSGGIRTVGYSLPVIFAGLDILREVKDYNETVESLK